jgi:hypothetical protein
MRWSFCSRALNPDAPMSDHGTRSTLHQRLAAELFPRRNDSSGNSTHGHYAYREPEAESTMRHKPPSGQGRQSGDHIECGCDRRPAGARFTPSINNHTSGLPSSRVRGFMARRLPPLRRLAGHSRHAFRLLAAARCAGEMLWASLSVVGHSSSRARGYLQAPPASSRAASHWPGQPRSSRRMSAAAITLTPMNAVANQKPKARQSTSHHTAKPASTAVR